MRTTAAIGHWCVFKDTRVFDIMIRDVCNQEIVLSRRGLLTNPLKEICEKDRSFLPKVAKVLESEHIIRCQFLMDIVCFGRDAVPHLVRGLQDESAMIRERSVDSLSRLRGDALDASPVLEEMLTNNRDVALWPAVHRALQIINPARFPEQPDK
jgi:hypothetical protein